MPALREILKLAVNNSKEGLITLASSKTLFCDGPFYSFQTKNVESLEEMLLYFHSV